jgi:hypothetical protein
MRNKTIAIAAEILKGFSYPIFHNTIGLHLERRSNERNPEGMHRYSPGSNGLALHRL